jgi:hypothetical protein
MKVVRPVIGLLVLTLALVASAPAQELSLSVGAGSFFASQGAYREVYGSSLLFSADVWLKLKGPFGIAAGFIDAADTGNAVPMDGGDAEYPVKFRRATIPIVVFYRLDVKAGAIRFGAGLGIHHYRETWQTVDLGFEGHKISLRFMLTAAVPLLKRLSLLGTIAYDTIRTGAGSPLAVDVNLGGFQVIGGLSFRII